MVDIVDNIQIEDEVEDRYHREYNVNIWPTPPDEPKGYTFKGKTKLMAFAMEKTKVTLKKGSEKEFDGLKFKVLDSPVHLNVTLNALG